MINAIIGAVGAIVCAIIGAGIMFYVQTSLRKDKFKEIVYKEHLAVYKETADGCRKLFVSYVNFLKKPKDADQAMKLHADALQLGDIMGRSWLLMSEPVYTHVGKMLCHTIDATEAALLIHDKPAQPFERAKDFNIHFRYREVMNTMRKELGIDAISEETIKTIEFGIVRRIKARENV